MTEPFSETRMRLLFELSNIIAQVYYDGNFIPYPVQFTFGLPDSQDVGFKRPSYEDIKARHKELESPLPLPDVIKSGKCKSGANHMYVIQLADAILRKLDGEYGFLDRSEVVGDLPAREGSNIECSYATMLEAALQLNEVTMRENERLKNQLSDLETTGTSGALSSSSSQHPEL